MRTDQSFAILIKFRLIYKSIIYDPNNTNKEYWKLFFIIGHRQFAMKRLFDRTTPFVVRPTPDGVPRMVNSEEQGSLNYKDVDNLVLEILDFTKSDVFLDWRNYVPGGMVPLPGDPI